MEITRKIYILCSRLCCYLSQLTEAKQNGVVRNWGLNGTVDGESFQRFGNLLHQANEPRIETIIVFKEV